MPPHKHSVIPEKYVSTLELNGLTGRVVHMPNKKKQKNILFVYGHHASLERMYPFMEILYRYGSVTAPDLPGFGGMDSLYTIGEEPSVDTLADYLAAVVKLRFKKQPIVVVGFSLGFLVVTRMLQKYPDIAQQTVTLISIAGFVSCKDFKISPRYKAFLTYGAQIFGGAWTSRLFRATLLRPIAIKSGYRYTPHARAKLKDYSPDDIKQMLQFEVELWRNNDVRTHMRTTIGMFTADLTKWPVNVPLHHVSMPKDQYFDGKQSVKSLQKVYQRVTVHTAPTAAHMPSVYVGDMHAGQVFPSSLRRVLSRQTSKMVKA